MSVIAAQILMRSLVTGKALLAKPAAVALTLICVTCAVLFFLWRAASHDANEAVDRALRAEANIAAMEHARAAEISARAVLADAAAATTRESEMVRKEMSDVLQKTGSEPVADTVAAYYDSLRRARTADRH